MHYVEQRVAPEHLQPNPWNTNVVSPENEQRIENGIKELGFVRPILARELEDGSLQIIGGEHRWQIAQRLGYGEVPVWNFGRIDEKTAKKIGLIDNARYGQDDALQLADLLKGIGSRDEIANILPYNDADLTALLDASSIAGADLDLPGTGAEAAIPERPAPTHQIMRFKVPVEDAAWASALLEKVMREQNFTSDDSMTNAGHALIHLLNKERTAS